MSVWQAFFLGMMVAWTPSLMLLAILLYETSTAKDLDVSNRQPW